MLIERSAGIRYATTRSPYRLGSAANSTGVRHESHARALSAGFSALGYLLQFPIDIVKID